jgi:hypothetical protein
MNACWLDDDDKLIECGSVGLEGEEEEEEEDDEDQEDEEGALVRSFVLSVCVRVCTCLWSTDLPESSSRSSRESRSCYWHEKVWDDLGTTELIISKNVHRKPKVMQLQQLF